MNYEHIFEQYMYEKNRLNEVANKLHELDITNKNSCCNMKYIMEKEGFYVCTNCGVTEKNTQIYNDDIYGFQNGKDCTFVHSIISDIYPESSIGTAICGNSRLAKIQQWNSMPYKERVIWEVSNELTSRLSGIFSENIIKESITHYKYLYNKIDIHRGKNKKGIIASCVYFAANNNNTKISPKKLASIMSIDVSTLNKCISIYIENMSLEINISKPEDYAQEYCNKYKISFKIQKLLIKICKVIEESDIVLGSVPQNTCLASLIFITREMGENNFSIKNMCAEYNVSVNTINKIIDIITKNKNYIFSNIK